VGPGEGQVGAAVGEQLVYAFGGKDVRRRRDLDQAPRILLVARKGAIESSLPQVVVVREERRQQPAARRATSVR
jgi:hypothetical protein